MSNLYIDNNPRFLTNVVGVYAMRNIINIFGIAEFSLRNLKTVSKTENW